MAVGILSVGMMLIATMFPVAIYLTSVASERTMASIIEDEAIAKIRLYGFGSAAGTGDYESAVSIDPNEFSYPSVDPHNPNPQYYWSAIYRKLSATDPNYQITVFVARKTNAGLMYPDPANLTGPPINTPRLIQISVTVTTGSNILTTSTGQAKYLNAQTAIVDDTTGKIYRVIDRKADTAGNPVITIDRNWADGTGNYSVNVWLIPPPTSGGKNADIEVYQRTISF